jgi:hypothetical protein
MGQAFLLDPPLEQTDAWCLNSLEQEPAPHGLVQVYKGPWRRQVSPHSPFPRTKCTILSLPPTLLSPKTWSVFEGKRNREEP